MASYETDEPVTYDVREGVAHLRLNRPLYGNAQNGQLLYALDEAFQKANADDAVGALVLAGSGRHFSSGHDIGTPGRDAEESAPRRVTLWPDHAGRPGAEAAYVREQELYLGMCRRWRAAPKPAVAAVHGACIAGGLMLAWVCDLIIASEDAYFCDPVLRMGVPGVEYFAHAFEMHPRVAREFLFLGENMPAARAHALGMVNRVVTRERLEEEAHEIARRIASLPRMGVMLAKQAFNAQEDLAGKRATMDSVFHMHHLAHAQNLLTSGSAIGNVTARDIAGKDNE